MVTKLTTGLLAFVLFLTGFAPLTSAQTVTAFVDRNPIHLGETVQFTIRWSGPNPGTTVILDALSKDFDVLGTSQSNRSSIINGQTKITSDWISTLSPKRAGKLLIPAIQVGPHQTPPITLTVLSESQPGQQGVSRDLFLETSIDSKEPYIQSQVTYTIRLYHAVPLREGRMEDPTVPDAMVTRLGEDVSYETVKDGRRYQVVERKFAIIPQKSGSLTIPPIVFVGKVPGKKNRRSFIDDFFGNQFRSFGNDPFSSIFQSTKPVRSRSEAHTLHVQPVPPSMKDEVWLPAKDLTLNESWVPDLRQGEMELRVGEPVTRTIVLRAKGVLGPQIPEVSLAEPSRLKIYPDQPKIDTEYEGAVSVGIREQKLALVPTAEGAMRLPEVRVPWWDVDQHKRRVAVLPARDLTILPEFGKSSSPGFQIPQPPTPSDSESDGSINSIKEGSIPQETALPSSTPHPLLWQGVAGVFLLGWLMTGVGWLYERRKGPRPKNHQEKFSKSASPSERTLLSEFRQACEENEPKKARTALLRWAQVKWQSPAPMGLGDVARHTKNADVQSAIWDLDRSIYASEGSPWDGSRFYQLVLPALDDTKPGKRSNQDELPPLYLTNN